MPFTILTAALALAGVALCAVAPHASAQASSAASAPSTADTLAEVRRIVAERYVLPEVGPKLAAAVARSEAAGRYRTLSGDALATQVNADFATVTADKHLNVVYAPDLAARMGDAPIEDDDALPPGMVRMVERGNGGVRAMEVFPGNVRYLAYDGFAWGTPAAEEALATAMRFLRGGDAIIIDVRRNGGGSPGAVAALTSYFLPAGTPLMRFEMRGRPAQSSATSATPFTLAGKPLYVLTSSGSASATEEFATHVAAFNLGTLVGETTAGAAYRNDMVALPGGYVLSVSVGRPVHAKTGGDWEAKGVAPAIAVPVDTALDRAKAEAMAAIAAKAPADERAEDLKIAALYRAVVNPATPALPLAAYPGRYGERVVTLRDGGLYSQRNGRQVVRLVALAPDRFVPEGDPMTEFRFVAEGSRIVAMEARHGDGPAEHAARVAP